MGLTEGAFLYRLLDQNMDAVDVRADGITLSQNLANKLGVKVGDTVSVQATDGHRAHADLMVVAVVKPYLAGAAYMQLGAIESRAARAGPRQRGIRADGSSRARRAQPRGEGNADDRRRLVPRQRVGVDAQDAERGQRLLRVHVRGLLVPDGRRSRLLRRARDVRGAGAGSRDAARAGIQPARGVLRSACGDRRVAAGRVARRLPCSARCCRAG